MLDVFDLSFDYQDKPLLKNVNFSLQAGQLLHLRGGNGAGKTTLLKLLAGLLHPHQGEIRYDGELIAVDPWFYQHNLCYVGHKSGVNPLLTVRENCLFDMHWGRQTIALESLLEKFNLQGLSDVLCHSLSAGQQRRVSLLRTVMSRAKIWLLDEPLVALDKEAMTVFIGLLKNHLLQDGQIILTSHQQLPLSQISYQEYAL